MNMNFSLLQLEEAQAVLLERMRQARADADYLVNELAQLLIGETLGAVTAGEVDEVRRSIEGAQQRLDETPAALAKIKLLIEAARLQEASLNRIDQVRATREEYMKLRDQIIADPDRGGREGGKLRGLADQLDRDVANGRLETAPVKYIGEARDLLEAAEDFVRYQAKGGAGFSFQARI